jgi:hypothetical protein
MRNNFRNFSWNGRKILGDVIAIDGKTICGSKDGALAKCAVHIVSACSSENELILRELAMNEKSMRAQRFLICLRCFILKDVL